MRTCTGQTTWVVDGGFYITEANLFLLHWLGRSRENCARRCLTAKSAAANAIAPSNRYQALYSSWKVMSLQSKLVTHISEILVQWGGDKTMVSRGAHGRARGGASAKRGSGAPAALRQISDLWGAHASAPGPLRVPASAGMPNPPHVVWRASCAHCSSATAACSACTATQSWMVLPCWTLSVLQLIKHYATALIS